MTNFYYDGFIQGCSICYGHAWDLCLTETKHSALSVHKTPDCVMYGTMQGSYDDLGQAMDMENPVGTTDTDVTSVLLVYRSVP